MRARIGYVSQLGGADDLATGRENLVLQGRLYGGAREQVRARVEELLVLLDLAGFADRRVKTYSGGQRRRLDVALGIVHEPAVLFLDEPTTGLDPQNRANLWDHLRALRERGTTIFLTTHYLEEADALCDRVMIIDHGLIVAEGARASSSARSSATPSCSASPTAPPSGRARCSRGAPFVSEVGAADEDGQLRCYVEDGAAALPEILRMLDGGRRRPARDQPVGADARRRVPREDRPLAARHRGSAR